MDDQAVDTKKNAEELDPYMSDEVAKLIQLRNKKLHEKAQNLLGRSFRNAIVHSSNGEAALSQRSKRESNKALNQKLPEMPPNNQQNQQSRQSSFK